MLTWVLVVSGVGAIVISLRAFWSKPEDAKLKFHQFEFAGPLAPGVLGVALLCGAAAARNPSPADQPASGSIAPEPTVTLNPPVPLETQPPARPVETINVPYYGALQIG